ncbi:MAG: hypothetical protein ACE5HX_05115 [bacterium]
MSIKKVAKYTLISIVAVGPSILFGAQAESGAEKEHKPAVTSPPVVLKLNLFYKKYLSANGIAVVSSKKVSDAALLEAAYIINHMLANRPDIRNALIKNNIRCAVMTPMEMTTDIPEHSDLKPENYWNKRARGLSATKRRPVVSCGEENLLNYPGDRYVGENILIHEFAHTIHEMGLNYINQNFDCRLKKLYKKAVEQGLWKDTYAGSNYKEFWAEGVQSWFDCNREKAEPDGIHNYVNTREELEGYDPNLTKLISEVFCNTPWRYQRPDDRKQPALRYLQQLRERTSKLKTYECRIEYLFSQPLLESETLRKGVMYYAKSGKKSKLRINFQTLKQDDEKEQEYIEQFIFDGIWLTHIDYQIKQVKMHQLAEPNKPVDAFDLASRNLPIIGFTKIEDLKKQFEIKLVKQQKGKPQNSIHLHLKVKPDSIYKDDYTSIDFWIDKKLHLPAKVVAISTEEDIYQIKLLKPKVNKKLDKKVFEIKIPKGFGKEIIPLKKKAK